MQPRLGRSSANIAESLEGADAKNSAGELVSAYSRFGLEIKSELDSIERIKQVPIATDSKGHIIRMEDIASVKRGEKTPQDQIAIIDGEPGVIVAARMHPDLRVDNWTSRANALIGKFEQELPSNVKVTVLFNQQGYTETRLDDLGKSLMIGFGLILIVSVCHFRRACRDLSGNFSAVNLIIDLVDHENDRCAD